MGDRISFVRSAVLFSGCCIHTFYRFGAVDRDYLRGSGGMVIGSDEKLVRGETDFW